jgi:site-specific DNA-methyltransferase (adenine-specific)
MVYYELPEIGPQGEMKPRRKQSCPPRDEVPTKSRESRKTTESEHSLPTEFARFPLRKSKAITLYHGDCFAGMDTILAEGSVDVLVTSPPYNIGVRYGSYDDRIPRSSYLEWMTQWAIRVKRVLHPKGSVFLNIGSKPSDPWIPFDVASRLRDIFVLQNVFHWVKSIYVENTSYNERASLSVGHFKPINSKRFVNDAHEYVFHFTHRGDVELDRLAVGVPYKDASNITRWQSAGQGLRCRGNNWYVPYKTIKERAKDRPHPATFPSELVEMCVKIHGVDRAHLALDPFLGIGATAVACAGLGVNMVGFEIDAEYLRAASSLISESLEHPAVPYP